MSIVRLMVTIGCAFLLATCVPVGVAFGEEGSDLATGTSTELVEPSVSSGVSADGAGQGAGDSEPGTAVKEPAKKVRIAEGAYSFTLKLGSGFTLGIAGKSAKSGHNWRLRNVQQARA